MSFDKEFDVVIIGGGPAGLSAAIYLQRANLNSCFIEKGAPGGKVVTTTIVENYPGFEKIEGPQLAYQMYDQATKLGSKYIGGNAISIKEDKDNYRLVVLEDKKIIRCKAVIIATGTENRKLNIPGEAKFSGRGVSYCAICDGMFYKGKDIAVIGSGNSAVGEAIYLSEIGNKVHLIVRGDHLKADPTEIQQLKTKNNVEILFNHETVSIDGTDNVQSIKIKDKVLNQEKILSVNAVFPFVGLIALDFDEKTIQIKRSEQNFIIVDELMHTSVQGIFAIGDITNKRFRQISTAVSDGTNAALACKEYINKNF